jgi:hypothetical protein
MTPCGPPGARPERIGVILVHGIGEQRRFEHLSAHARDLIRALEGLRDEHDPTVRPKIGEVTVDISGAGAAALHAEQDTWTSGPGPSVTVAVKRPGGREQRLLFHEVWWADVNERYSLAKQWRFWRWGIAIWMHPGKRWSALQSANRVAPPAIPRRRRWWDRARLFLVGAFFVLLGCSVGAVTFLAERLLNWQAPRVLRALANYISAVKLYSQQHRLSPGLFPQREDFLDTVGEPPRVSIRRRMIRAIADVACNDYDRWYVLAHSQGGVVAFNGLMETAYAWPGYLDERRWQRLRARDMAGPRRAAGDVPEPEIKPTMPRRPGWARPDSIAYRSRILSRFRGMLTYGCPLEKFAGIWPAVVPISREPAFVPGTPWLNVLDPTDPVSGRLLAFEKQPETCCPRPVNIGYGASWWLLLSHLKYLTRRRGGRDLATAVCRWLLDGTFAFQDHKARGWRCGAFFTPGYGSGQAWLRTIIA